MPRMYRPLTGILHLVIACISAFFIGFACSSSSGVDTVLYNARIITLNANEDIAEAIAIRDSVIVAAGSNKDILALAGFNTKHLDLSGKTVIPGLGDNHFHSIGGGPGVDLSHMRSLDDVIEAIARQAEETPPGEVILTNSDWHEGQLKEHRMPYRDDLDRATIRHPVVVVRGGHQYLLNSAAIEKWNITPATPVPAGGSIGRYPDGRLNGELVDRAKDLVTLPEKAAPDFEEQVTALEDEYHRLNAVGLTSLRYAGAPHDLYKVVRTLKERGQLTLRINFLFRIPASAKPEELDAVIGQWGVEQNEGDAWLKVGGVKLGVDGGFEGGLMREPYADPMGHSGQYYGLQIMPTDRYTRLVGALNLRGWRVATHAVGDAAIDLVLNAYERTNRGVSIEERRWSIEHGFLPRPDQFERMRDLGLLVTAQDHLYVAGPSLMTYWGEQRARMVTPVRTYLDEGILVSSGTDSPVIPYNPFWTMYHFITRETISAGVLGEEERIDRLDALRLATVNYAYLTFEEDLKGALEPGEFADLAVLSQDILTCPEEAIRDMEVEMTMVGGRIVYDRAASAR